MFMKMLLCVFAICQIVPVCILLVNVQYGFGTGLGLDAPLILSV